MANAMIRQRKYIGYKEFAQFASFDNDFFCLRRFDSLHVRVLLRQQDRLSELETGLQSLDAKLSRRDAKDIDNGSFRKDVDERINLLGKIEDQLKTYGKLPLDYPAAGTSHCDIKPGMQGDF